jgi:hypothetical protein
MVRASRLQAAPKFIAGFKGKRLVVGYANWFGVDRFCAIRELRMLGVLVPESEVRAAEGALRAAQARTAKVAEANAERAFIDAAALWDSDIWLSEDD